MSRIALDLRTALLPHQAAAVDKLTPLKVGALLMDMGTGKSRCSIEIAARRFARGRIRRVLWFCPVAVKQTILRELYKHVDQPRVHVFNHPTRHDKLPEAEFYVVGIESMSTSHRVQLAAARIAEDGHTMIVLDESNYCKNHHALRTRWIERVGDMARYRLLMTGTIISQGIVDLYAQVHFLSPEILGYRSFYSFAANHLEYSDKFPGLIVRAHNTAYLAAKMAPYVYEVSKDECLTLPPKLYESRWLEMTRTQSRLYEQAKDEILMEIPEGDFWEQTVIYRLFGALQQITCGFWHRVKRDLRTGEVRSDELIEVPHRRLDVMEETIGELPPDKPVVVWANYHHSVEAIAARLQKAFPNRGVSLYYGALSEKQRDKELLAFSSGQNRFFVGTPDSGSHGLNELANAPYFLFYSNSFKASIRRQTEDRGHRMETRSSPTYIDLICANSIDQRILDALTNKISLAREFRDKVRALRATKTARQAARIVMKEMGI